MFLLLLFHQLSLPSPYFSSNSSTIFIPFFLHPLHFAQFPSLIILCSYTRVFAFQQKRRFQRMFPRRRNVAAVAVTERDDADVIRPTPWEEGKYDESGICDLLLMGFPLFYAKYMCFCTI